MVEHKLTPLPRTALMQVRLFPNEAELDEVTQRLHSEIRGVVEQQQISIIDSSARTKTLERRMDKLQRRGWDFPLPDVHGVRLILATPDTHPAAQVILDHYPSPEEYWWGLPSYRDYSDPNTKGKYNRASLSSYEAIHLNIRINEGARLAEVQIMTPEQLIIAEQTREEYLRRQSSF
jgi:hypothetical protein